MKDRTDYLSHGGIMTYLRAPYIDIEEARENTFVVVGAPFDTSSGTRPGARYAPNEIRKHSVHFIYHYTAIDGQDVVDVDSKRRMHGPMKNLVFDAGDVRVFPTDVAKTTQSIAAAIETITEKGATPVMLGGDHFVAYPAVLGFEKGLAKRLGRQPKIGYLHVDAHLDACDDNDTWGKCYHGSPARRVSELAGVSMKNMVFLGISGSTGTEPYRYITENGATIFTAQDIRKQGAATVTKKALEIAGEGVDALYVTLDIDAIDFAYAQGTGSYVFGGITADEFLELVGVVSKDPRVGGIDLVEVAPTLDPTGATSRLAATAITGFLKPHLFTFSDL